MKDFLIVNVDVDAESDGQESLPLPRRPICHVFGVFES